MTINHFAFDDKGERWMPQVKQNIQIRALFNPLTVINDCLLSTRHSIDKLSPQHRGRRFMIGLHQQGIETSLHQSVDFRLISVYQSAHVISGHVMKRGLKHFKDNFEMFRLKRWKWKTDALCEGLDLIGW